MSPISAIPVPDGGLAPRADVRFENRLIDAAEGVFEDSFSPYAVHLYEIPFSVQIDRESIGWLRWQRRRGY